MVLFNVVFIISLCSLNVALVDVDLVEIRCRDDVVSTISHCTFLRKGQYKLLDVDGGVKTVTFDRLTNSQVLIPDHVNKLILFSSAFDTLMPCEHVITEQKVMVRIDDKDEEILCVSKLYVTIKNNSNIHMSRDA